MDQRSNGPVEMMWSIQLKAFDLCFSGRLDGLHGLIMKLGLGRSRSRGNWILQEGLLVRVLHAEAMIVYRVVLRSVVGLSGMCNEVACINGYDEYHVDAITFVRKANLEGLYLDKEPCYILVRVELSGVRE